MDAITRFWRTISPSLGPNAPADAGARTMYLVVPEETGRSIGTLFSQGETAREYLRYLQAQHERAQGEVVAWRVVETPCNPEPRERRGAWIVRIDRDGNPIGPATFSLSRRPADPPHEFDLRAGLEAIGEIRDYVGYGRSPAEARRSAEDLRRRMVNLRRRDDS